MLKTALILLTISSSALWPVLSTQSAETELFAAFTPQSTNGPVMNQAALEPFFRQLAALETQARRRPLRIIQYGDSHTKADLFTGAVRKELLRDFGGVPQTLVRNTAYSQTAASYRTVYQPAGINGARAKRLREMSEDQGFLNGLTEARPDLIVLAYGTNEVTDGDWTVNSYSRMFVSIINRMRAAAPEASFLIIGPPDRAVPASGGWSSARRMADLQEAQRLAAISAGAAFWSEFEAMGGEGSMNRWVSRGLGRFDHVHFTAVGYAKLADLFYRDLMSCYHGRQRSPLPRQSGQTPANGIDSRIMQGIPIPTRNRN